MTTDFDLAQTQTTLFAALLDARDRFGGKQGGARGSGAPAADLWPPGARRPGARAEARGHTDPGERVGVLLPNVQGLAVVLFGLNAFGRVPAMLNFTAGVKNLRAACEMAGIRTIVTSRRFVEQGKLDEVVAALERGTPARLARGRARRRSRASTKRAAFSTACSRPRFMPASASSRTIRPSSCSPRARRARRRASCSPAPTSSPTRGRSRRMPGAALDRRRHLLQSAADVPFLRSDGGAAHRRPQRHEGGALSEPAALPSGAEARSARRARRSCSRPTLSSRATPAPPTRAISRRVRYVIAGAERVKDETRRLWDTLRDHDPRRLWRDRMLARDRRATSRTRNRPGSVGPFLPGIEWRLEPVEGIHEGGRLVVQRSERHEGLPRPGAPGGIAPPEGRLARHGRHRDGRGRLRDDPRSRQALRQDRRRDGVARQPSRRWSRVSGPNSITSSWRCRTRARASRSCSSPTSPPRTGERCSQHAKEQGFPELWVPEGHPGCGDPGPRQRQDRLCRDGRDGEKSASNAITAHPQAAPGSAAVFARYNLEMISPLPKSFTGTPRCGNAFFLH